jgi:hypothetical protein
MGKGSGACGRPGISLEAGHRERAEKNEPVADAEIKTTLELERVEGRWFTKDNLVAYQKTKEGWRVGSISVAVRKAFNEYGISYKYTCFPSLKAARKAVSDVALETGLNIDSRLTRGKLLSYKTGDLPFYISKAQGHWRVYALIDEVPQSLQKYFNSVEEFRAAWNATSPVTTHYPTRKAAHQAVINWLDQTVAKGK